MPLKYQGKSYSFAALVKLIMRKKGWKAERARRFVGRIQSSQEKGHKGLKFRGK